MPYGPGHSGTNKSHEPKKQKGGLKNGIKILKQKVDIQIKFIEWLKTKGLYIPTESGHIMQKMFEVWEAMKEEQ
jgi:hypothetical protein